MKKTILAVDDSVSIREMVAFTVGRAGYDVIEAVDGRDALEKAARRTVDLVLTDQNMPRMDGISLVRELRALPQYVRTPMLLLTTESGEELKAKGRAARATGWIVKPFDPVTLLDVIRRVLG